jgi:hypothetical protein
LLDPAAVLALQLAIEIGDKLVMLGFVRWLGWVVIQGSGIAGWMSGIERLGIGGFAK